MEERYRALAEERASQAAAKKGLELELESARKAGSHLPGIDMDPLRSLA